MITINTDAWDAYAAAHGTVESHVASLLIFAEQDELYGLDVVYWMPASYDPARPAFIADTDADRELALRVQALPANTPRPTNQKLG